MSKNRKKKKTIGPGIFALLILTAISIGTTGIFHTVMKNRQLEVVREIEKVERRVKEYERDVTNLEIRLSQLENRWDLRNRLVAAKTKLVGIPIEVIEDVSALGVSPEMASND